jgi:type II secretory pathway pseudopilin PulG
MMIVMGIIAVLVAIALPTAFSMIKDGRIKQTKSTMDTIAAAIERFNRDNPFTNNKRTIRQITFAGTPPTVTDYDIRMIFDRYPPSPTTAFSIDPANPQTFVSGGLGLPSPPYPATKEDDTELPAGASELNTRTKFLRLIYVMNGRDFISTDPAPWTMRNDKNMSNTSSSLNYAKPYASIECLIYTLREFSSGARDIIDKLPASALTNLDKDFVFQDANANGVFETNERQATLFEVVDAWKKPLRYAIRERWQPTKISGFAFKWELRSAGEDGVFALPFRDADQSDDVILQGP